MDQTSVYWEMGRRTTVEFVGATTVRATTNTSEGYRCTMAVTAAADGRVLPPHFAYNGVPGGDMEAEVTKYCSGEVATFSVQESAWFDERVMMEWIDKCWKHIHIRRLNTLSRGRSKKVTPQFRRRSIFETAMDGLRCVSSNTVKNAFVKAGPFVPFGLSNHADILTDVGNEPAASCSADVILEEAVL
ncbi:unnamed protein product [Phytophthora lilii]|uniref:Unnamed protein product n=1 Tax=Phytophthora lilii TaxID=2077276 RepID=A0A9W6U845_9STRA|nr:unnamed protein product [Phytophthora lilii]